MYTHFIRSFQSQLVTNGQTYMKIKSKTTILETCSKIMLLFNRKLRTIEVEDCFDTLHPILFEYHSQFTIQKTDLYF